MHLGKTLNLLVTNFEKHRSHRTDSRLLHVESVQKWPHNAVMSNLEWEVKSKISKIKQQNYLFVF